MEIKKKNTLDGVSQNPLDAIRLRIMKLKKEGKFKKKSSSGK